MNYEKGFEGELKFDQIADTLLPSSDWLILTDLLFEWNNNRFQIDDLLISENGLYPFEVKNHEGDYYVEKDKWYTVSGIEVNNPIHQLRRADMYLKKLFHANGIKLPIESLVAFVHPGFALYQAPMRLPFLLPGQIKRHFVKLSNIPSKLNANHFEWAKRILALTVTESPYDQVPEYHDKQLKKGVYCASCHTFSLKMAGRHLICQSCGAVEPLESAVMRSVNEFHILFPERKITVQAIKEWCDLDVTRRRIEWILKKNMGLINKGKYSYYIFKE
ncbi:nuclease-related domain-containing protein [Camelliibacillus cellulosilyticus]|uniref:Nuclease-related domain-containing protein n=1 Tax=Camelliibacillus cellulosilyticus TaxID=2174486 RepID=A0ABV9GS86_9BACL